MRLCPKCELPLVWSVQRERIWCCVYGDHAGTHHRAVLVIAEHDRLAERAKRLRVVA